MKERDLSYLIIGYNKGQKQGINLKKKTNQSFVQVPFARFRRILQTVCVRYGIRVILQEESYTSKACFGNRDYIPTYGTGDAGSVSFTGKRIKRGLYLQDDGKVMNADIGVSVTGNAGPGATENKPVGLVFIGVSSEKYSAVLENHFEGDRVSVREQAADAALLIALSAAEKL
jgi:IS605 OrfB family transposase